MSLLDRFRSIARVRIPERLARGAGNGDAAAIGAKWARTFAVVGGLRGRDRILDIGCGPGRMAVGIGERFDWRNAYLGFDVKRDDIAFARREISGRHASFEFVHLDARNGLYNPRGAIAPMDATFPAGDSSVDFALATSVFTHMLGPEVERYLAEAARTLRPDGRLLCSFYCLHSRGGEGEPRFRFGHQAGPDCFVEDPRRPEDAVAFRLERVIAMIGAAGFRDIVHLPGAWTGAKGRHGQDVITATR